MLIRWKNKDKSSSSNTTASTPPTKSSSSTKKKRKFGREGKIPIFGYLPGPKNSRQHSHFKSSLPVAIFPTHITINQILKQISRLVTVDALCNLLIALSPTNCSVVVKR
ncbi:hypothetical protein J6590_047412 [Homalodisca vitripennis]|nr:hypothetical protein J6590_047412 [Homalodisca vitripennis]